MALASPPLHHCRVFATPWPGVYATHTDSGRHFGRHSHATFGFGLLEAGAQHSASGRGAVQAYAGDLMTTNPGEVHDGRPLGTPSRRWRMLHLPAQVLAATAGVPAEVALTRPVLRDPALGRAVRRLLDSVEGWAAGRCEALACEEALVGACAGLLAGHGTIAPVLAADAAPVARARERLADDLAQPPSLAELAALAGLGRFQLLRRFRQAYGVTPHAWLQQQRAERARGLIARGLPLAQAAAASGFADQSHMTRLFTRQFGFTPGAWRRAAAPLTRPQ
ncbi:AraC family transcriptional regulator [Ramlibacter tataouinensis]|uniref:Transcriptional regulator, AraC family-like protein n=1 Tax=Ramlibacter tataouinensis (strain ATCC BAA-407 / DSM 14655 / LMG 21543 / TTB310) TaxID=365046 RepID=F5Y512_RAMTT|nr:AraC family transcriptional regulator [Ramlibacter tataouinensis]AEG93852.1 transcriptional regulator, AraC family-like protein [Ramlibacter tataouinensis TTB310]